MKIKKNELKFNRYLNISLLGVTQYSLRRYYIDKVLGDFLRNDVFGKPKVILDIGGKKGSLRSKHSIEKFRDNLLILNLERNVHPDIVADATFLPFKNNSIDEIFCIETLEHVLEPKDAVYEILRVLKVGGHALVTVPFLFRVHGDPFDYTRFTWMWIRKILENYEEKLFFEISNHGSHRSVIIEILRERFFKKKYNRLNIFLILFYLVTKKWAIFFDANEESPYTLGYSIYIEKKKP